MATLNRREQHHAWARRTLDSLDAPLVTCEAVLSEAWFLLRRGGADPSILLDLLEVLGVEIAPAWNARTEVFLRRYAGRASVADASLLMLAEQQEGRVVVTADRENFTVYRIHRRQAVASIMPGL